MIEGMTGDACMDALLHDCILTMKAKGHEYTGGSADRLNNFRTIATEIGLPMRQVWYVYFNKHLRALQTWVRDGELKSNETVQDRMVDLVNYLLLGSLIASEEAVTK